MRTPHRWRRATRWQAIDLRGRAIGLRRRTVEDGFAASRQFFRLMQGYLALGLLVVLGVVTTWLLYGNSPTFGSLDAPFPIAWRQIALTVGVTLLASLLATIGPARRAASIRPAIAVRVAD